MPDPAFASPAPEPRFAVLRNRNFSLLWVGLIISNSGSWMTLIGLGWLVYQLSGSAFALGIVGVARAIPMVIFPPMGGVLADRLPRLKLLKVTQTLSCFLSLGLALLVELDLIEVWQIVTFSFLTGLVNAFDQPTRQALLPDLVRREDLTKAVALQSSAWQGSALFGPTLAGITIAALGVGGAFFFDGVSFLAVLLSLFLMRGVPEHGVTSGERRNFGSDLKGGMSYVMNAPLLGSLLLMSTIAGVFGRSFQQFLPVFAEDTFHKGSFGLGMLASAPGAGALAGAAIITMAADVRRKGQLFLGTMLCFGISLVLFSLSRNFIVGLGLLFIVGVLSLSFTSMLTTIIQLEAAPEMRGRVMSLVTVTMQGFSPLGGLFIGALAGLIGTPEAVAISAAACSMVALLGFVAIPVVRRYESETLPVEAASGAIPATAARAPAE
jgi:MFS family permease